jgi:hypothetical protein
MIPGTLLREEVKMTISNFVGMSDVFERSLVRILQGILVGLFFFGFYQNDISLIVSSGIAIAVSVTPALLRRDYGFPLDSGLVLWITAAIFLHVLGNVWLYGYVGWYDQFAHLVSATIVTGISYSGLYAIERHAEGIEIPPKYMFFFLFTVMLAFGIVWEILEYASGGLTIHGVDDIALDLLFDAIGAAIVIVLNTPQLRRLGRDVANRFEGR